MQRDHPASQASRVGQLAEFRALPPIGPGSYSAALWGSSLKSPEGSLCGGSAMLCKKTRNSMRPMCLERLSHEVENVRESFESFRIPEIGGQGKSLGTWSREHP